MTNNDNRTQQATTYALQDLKKYIANASSQTTEASILAWQQGYISGINRGMEISDDQMAQKEE